MMVGGWSLGFGGLYVMLSVIKNAMKNNPSRNPGIFCERSGYDK